MKSFRTLLVAVISLASSYQAAYALPWYDGVNQPSCIQSSPDVSFLWVSAKWTCEPIVETATVNITDTAINPGLRLNQFGTHLMLNGVASTGYENFFDQVVLDGTSDETQEINASHFEMYVLSNVNIVSTSALESIESKIDAFGSVKGWTAILGTPAVYSGGAITGQATGLYWQPSNSGATAIGTAVAVFCPGQTGGGPLPNFDYCLQTKSTHVGIALEGHIATISNGGATTVTGGTLDANATDLAGTLTLTSSSATVSFAYQCGSAPHVQLSTNNGAANPTSVTKNTAGFTVNGVSGASYDYVAMCVTR